MLLLPSSECGLYYTVWYFVFTEMHPWIRERGFQCACGGYQHLWRRTPYGVLRTDWGDRHQEVLWGMLRHWTSVTPREIPHGLQQQRKPDVVAVGDDVRGHPVPQPGQPYTTLAWVPTHTASVCLRSRTKKIRRAVGNICVPVYLLSRQVREGVMAQACMRPDVLAKIKLRRTRPVLTRGRVYTDMVHGSGAHLGAGGCRLASPPNRNKKKRHFLDAMISNVIRNISCSRTELLREYDETGTLEYWKVKLNKSRSDLSYVYWTVRHLDIWIKVDQLDDACFIISLFKLFGAGIIFFKILAHPIYKMWIIQEPNTVELRNKLHFEEKKKRRVYTVFKIFSTFICWINI